MPLRVEAGSVMEKRFSRMEGQWYGDSTTELAVYKLFFA
jgi:hypothetical protein